MLTFGRLGLTSHSIKEFFAAALTYELHVTPEFKRTQTERLREVSASAVPTQKSEVR